MDPAYFLSKKVFRPPGDRPGLFVRLRGLSARVSACVSGLSFVAASALWIAMLVASGPVSAYEAFQNGRLRFGTGAEASVNAGGTLQQPFYYDSVLGGGGWYKLTYSSYPLNIAIGVGGDGTSNWNLNGSISQDPALSGQLLDVANFVRTSGSMGYGTIISKGNVTVGGQTFEVRNSYSLGQTDSFIRITTRITNTGAAPLQNVRVWVGTRDDWVGTTDSPTKRRGNLVNGVFTQLTSPATRSAALQVSSGSTGVLFFSTSSRAYTSINNCCSFSNSYGQNPETSAITLTNDGSYALFVRMNDLAAGQSDEFTWFYAAGELGNLGQIVAAVGAAAAITLPMNGPVTPFTPVSSSGGTGPFTYSISPPLPPGLTFNTSNGQISGTPLAPSPTTVYTVTITDSVPSSTSATFTMTVTSGTTQVSVSSSVNVAAFGAPVTVRAEVTGTNPTGTVTFTVIYKGADDTVILPVCVDVPLVAGSAECIVPGEFHKVSPISYHVAYSGDAQNPPLITSLLQLVTLTRSTLTAVAAPQAPLAGRNLALNAMVVQPGLTGKVTFYEHGMPLPGCSEVALAPIGGSTDAGTATCRINAVAAGNHMYAVTLPHTSGSGFEQVAVAVHVAAAGPEDYSDLWWGGTAENGWGMSVTQHGTTQFAVLFVYDSAGNPVWYTMPGGTWNAAADAYSGLLYQPTGTPHTAYDASQFRANDPVGTLTITYAGQSTASLAYTINGVSGTKQVVRQGYPGEDGRSRVMVADMWWGGSKESGWGLSIDQHGGVLFPIWYTYDATGKTCWFTVPGGSWNGTTFTGDVYLSTSAPWLGVRYESTAFSPRKVGTLSLTFIDQETATMRYTVEGFTHIDTLVRQGF
ncbi:MAG TPA: Ig domain-containing protein [Usitatibacteraceae bacterium]|nr:Ig domain-containing protein [Usitatibacteraceae bacterium]